MTGFVLAVVGLALLLVEVVRTLNGSSLGSLGAILLWAGVGLIAVAIVLLTAAMLAPAVETGPAGDVPPDAGTAPQPQP